MPHIAIIVSPYYQQVSNHLLAGSKAHLDKNNVTYDVFEVPGALEIPLAVQQAINTDKYEGAIALGCVIRGETSHYDIVCNESARGLSDLALAYGFPIGNGILTCDTMDQAIVRGDPAQKNKGAAAADAVCSLIELGKKI